MKKAAWVGAALAAVAVWVVLFGYPDLLPQEEQQFKGTCRALPTAAGAGDITVDSARGVAFLAYLDRTPNPEGKPSRGTVMLVDLNAAEPRVRAALVTDPPDFRPIALSLYAPAEGGRRLFVVDVGTSPAVVQIFEQSSSGGFALTRTVRDPQLQNPTAIVAVGPEQFYATTDATALDPNTSSRLARWWRLAFPARPSARSSVVFYNGQQMTVVADRMDMAAGIDSSPDGSTVYVGEMGNKRLHAFARDAASGALKLKESIELPSRPNHVHADAAGNIWIAAHPRAVAALKSLEGTQARAPTQVLKFSPIASKDARVSNFYLNDGTEVSGGTAAVMHAKQLLIGSWISRKLLLCADASRTVARTSGID